ncbi:hypothetical protein WALSEDRAFT_67262 [Wallemia mellicola CBS 633.66]|uniref:Uncharacterized protein n=1 Tax=Wallemia mellicola (strain ATCC MYA-4683 / CBS 633.66) TaxID=671144 RepID=I4YI33_WALMC|nr:hypothetical protein WALSEDRAFT_67262 [Wallemia mellicola CBS 633.66]EIM23625.1 hypothetical protein WALSEDRAFT_67262 [Wallemia mellicola CBS 633.66]|eukprot:XP_006956295.1 hypothetical protein WALSEDRAFT_67262 [Wallemia mellicola CBS 633.66]
MKFSIALATTAAILSVASAVPVYLERRDPVYLERRGAGARSASVRRGALDEALPTKRGVLTRDEHDHHDDHIDFHHLSHDEEKALYQTGDYYPELFSEEAYDHKAEHKSEEKHDDKHDEHDDKHDEHDDHEQEEH